MLIFVFRQKKKIEERKEKICAILSFTELEKLLNYLKAGGKKKEKNYDGVNGVLKIEHFFLIRLKRFSNPRKMAISSWLENVEKIQ